MPGQPPPLVIPTDWATMSSAVHVLVRDLITMARALSVDVQNLWGRVNQISKNFSKSSAAAPPSAPPAHRSTGRNRAAPQEYSDQQRSLLPTGQICRLHGLVNLHRCASSPPEQFLPRSAWLSLLLQNQRFEHSPTAYPSRPSDTLCLIHRGYPTM